MIDCVQHSTDHVDTKLQEERADRYNHLIIGKEAAHQCGTGPDPSHHKINPQEDHCINDRMRKINLIKQIRRTDQIMGKCTLRHKYRFSDESIIYFETPFCIPIPSTYKSDSIIYPHKYKCSFYFSHDFRLISLFLFIFDFIKRRCFLHALLYIILNFKKQKWIFL